MVALEHHSLTFPATSDNPKPDFILEYGTSFVSDFESRDIELSTNWIAKFNIFTKSESDDLYTTVMNLIYNFKYKKVEDHLLSIKSAIGKGDLSDEDILLAMGQQMIYENVKKVISEKLGRIILK